jgi:hypothetical protein
MVKSLLAATMSAAVVAGGALVGVTVAATPAQAVRPIIACTWIEAGGQDNRENTTRCTRPGKPATQVTHRDCWKYEPPADSIVRVRKGTKWRATDIEVDVRQAKRCPDSHPWLTKVVLPTEGMKAYQTEAYRLFMPAHEVEVYGKTIEVDNTRLDMFVCLMRDGRDKTCP